ncbi:hypothetical protein BUW96_13635 [Achromobacter insolitus]|uniref:hypothetical protein n=1 Tax=Achromobacter insolitus TaxID=217204 RepID=UPI000972BDEE|nr:hypothetical protein [Achromobacter insolitus]APX75807.1 hypothetical protein BUW96_13635 [Achromobacter insolitus]OWT56448.1 hypothetical protein CEY08_22345 [Achromobacter insolitus]
MTTIIELLNQRRRALLVQELERQWPGCGAHTKRNQLTRQDDVVWSLLLPKHVDAEIRVYVRGWNAAMDDAQRVVAAASPLEGSDVPATPAQAASGPRGNRPPGRRDPAAARAARNSLEALFADAPGDANA